MNTEKGIVALVRELDRIAALNNDEFAYTIGIHRLNGHHVFTFQTFETSDRHLFLSGDGYTLEEALAKARSAIPEACKDWGYKTE